MIVSQMSKIIEMKNLISTAVKVCFSHKQVGIAEQRATDSWKGAIQRKMD